MNVCREPKRVRLACVATIASVRHQTFAEPNFLTYLLTYERYRPNLSLPIHNTYAVSSGLIVPGISLHSNSFACVV